jgi:hypothetical protein
MLFGMFVLLLAALLAPWLGDSFRELAFKPEILGLIVGAFSGVVSAYLLKLSKQ